MSFGIMIKKWMIYPAYNVCSSETLIDKQARLTLSISLLRSHY